MLCLIIVTFSNALVILDKKLFLEDELDTDSYTSFLSDVSGNNLMNSFIQQLLLGLGTIPTDNIMDNKFRVLIWFYLLLAIIITNIAFLNILIAIVGDTFEKIMASKERSHLIEQV
jgi:hypothetical protein